jgi:cation-transporting ATPase 13A2
MRDAVYYEDKVDSTRLVPGDIIYINPDEKVPCDLILLDGQALIDESLLTGESVPMLKTPVPRNEALFSDQNKEYIIYAGTYAITSVSSTNKDQPAKAMVFQIGFGTTKGRLIRSIMFNDPAMYRFERDSNYFTLYLFIIAMFFVAAYYYICFVVYPDGDREFWDIFLPSCDMVLTMVPPGLSLSLSIGIEYSQTRLKNGQIMALKGRLINAAGRMKAMFFDKTGTLTINEMKLHNVIMNSDSWKQGRPAELVDLEHGKGYNASNRRKQASLH